MSILLKALRLVRIQSKEAPSRAIVRGSFPDGGGATNEYGSVEPSAPAEAVPANGLVVSTCERKRPRRIQTYQRRARQEHVADLCYYRSDYRA